MVIGYTTFQPFESRVGKDTVVKMISRYDATLVEQLKEIRNILKVSYGVKNPGGWLQDHKAWFWEHSVWNYVKGCLQAYGHQVRVIE